MKCCRRKHGATSNGPGNAITTATGFIGGSYRFERERHDRIIDALKSILHAGIASMHTAHHPEITLTGEVAARGVWYLTDWVINFETKTVTHDACLTNVGVVP